MNIPESDRRLVADKETVRTLVSRGDFRQAADLCGRLCKRNSTDPEAWFLLGAIQGRLQDWQAAESSCRRAIELVPDHAMLRFNLAIALLHLQKADQAVEQLEKTVSLQPDFINGHVELGNACARSGQTDRAVCAFEKALEMQPDCCPAALRLAHIWRDRNRFEDAERLYRHCIAVQPDIPEAWCELGGILIRQFRLDRAIELLAEAARRFPGDTGILSRLAAAWQEQGDTVKARNVYDEIMAIEPDHPDARAGIAGLLALQGDVRSAGDILEQLLDEQPGHTGSVITFASFAHRIEATDRAVRLVEQKLADASLTDEIRSKLNFALAHIYDKQGRYDLAFEHFSSANRQRRAVYDHEQYRNAFLALETRYSQAAMSSLPRSTRTSDTPLFIVGMPRSGTSLTEQILASHPRVFGAGELVDINRIVEQLPATLGTDSPYPACLDALSATDLDRLADRYLAGIAQRSGNARHVTDKMPLNFMHLGFIQLLLPNARVIHCIRDPRDTCLSCYFQSFSGEYPYAFSLTDIGRFYRLYEKLMAHWKQTLQLPVYELVYERLVTDQEAETRRLLEYCGLAWDDNCMAFHTTARTVSTASFDQVRKPMYTNSLARWRRYERFIGPLVDALEQPD